MRKKDFNDKLICVMCKEILPVALYIPNVDGPTTLICRSCYDKIN